MLDVTSVVVHRTCSSNTLNIDSSPPKLMKQSTNAWNINSSMCSNNTSQYNNQSEEDDEGVPEISQNSFFSNNEIKSENCDGNDLWATFCSNNIQNTPNELFTSLTPNKSRENGDTRKRKRSDHRMSDAVRLLKESANNDSYHKTNLSNENINDKILKTPKKITIRDPTAINNSITTSTNNTNDTDLLYLLCNESGNENEAIFQDLPENDCQKKNFTPYYMTGFPNPPGENRCWLNATLHALFVLPLIDYLDNFYLHECSRLTKTLVAIQIFWRRGAAEKEKTYQTLVKFKEELKILDESYSSKKQQDVSEFLMIFLNYVRTECEKLISDADPLRINSTQDIENVENRLSIDNKNSEPMLTPKKRISLIASSPLKEKNNQDNDVSVKLTHSSYPLIGKNENEKSNSNNPIDEYFLLHMTEHYVCQNCNKHRERDIDDLMLYVDLPNKENEVTDLAELIAKSMGPDERNFVCVTCKSNVHNVSTTFRGCPNILIVQINRYGMTQDGYVEKINSPIDIPATLTLTYDGDDVTHNFQPICIISHVGSSIDYGHYTSYVKHADQWYHYNDMDVTQMTESEALSAGQTTAYLVFFINNRLLNKLKNFLSVKIEDDSL